MALKPAFLNKLQYLLTVGYDADIVESFRQYCTHEVFDEDAVMDDLDDRMDSSIIEHLQQTHSWNEQQVSDFFTKVRQALDIDPKPAATQQPTPQKNSQSKPYLNGQTQAHQQYGHGHAPQHVQRESSSEQLSPSIAMHHESQSTRHKLYVRPDHIDYHLTQSELNSHKKVYFRQCSRLLPLDQRTGDEALLRVLSIGRKNNTPLLQNIADTYSRVRINDYVNKHNVDLKESEFALQYSYFRKLKQLNENRNAEYLQSALQSFHKRICPKIQFKSLLRINDSLPAYFEYVSATIKFVHNVVSQEDALPPFQIDFWIIPKNVKASMTFETDKFDQVLDDTDTDDDDEDDSDDDYNTEFQHNRLAEATIGDIEGRLQHEKLLYDTNAVEFNSPIRNNQSQFAGRRFERELDKKCKDFWKLQQSKHKEEFHAQHKHAKYVEADRSGAHKTRVCIVIDRRKPKDSKVDSDSDAQSPMAKNSKQKKTEHKTWEDRMYIFSPPRNCNVISDAHVPESYFNSSKECILPGRGYNDGMGSDFNPNGVASSPSSKKKKQPNMRHVEEEKYDECDSEDIEVGKPVGGYQFTLSFHVEASDDIKCYIFYNGWIARFFPSDMIDIWPQWFDESKENLEFVNNTKKWKSRINGLQQLLVDDQFSQWYKDSTKRDDLLKQF
eukprot:CAMPEP_0197053780 /NCGR_PEP_ID=MMETSP1384-20130603/27939_1 /TAXON_ID=29189 /ORGANISM="Ammonia sp." /LENGTH=666 /DNA_ID=CAMNT_0042486723 /DNA_START=2037 /DNA_END=4037 /DNA_ORIENTATION=+